MIKGRPKKDPATRVDNRASRSEESAFKFIHLDKIPEPVRDLGKLGKREYKRIVKVLQESGLFHEIDLPVIESACKYYDTHCQLENNMLDINDRFDETPNGMTIIHAWSIESKRCFESYMKIMLQFGVTPLARSRITIKAKTEDDEMNEFEQKYGS